MLINNRKVGYIRKVSGVDKEYFYNKSSQNHKGKNRYIFTSCIFILNEVAVLITNNTHLKRLEASQRNIPLI